VHDEQVRCVLLGVFGACSAPPVAAIQNRGGAASPTCDLPARLDFEARRYGTVDTDQPDYQTWSAWRVGLQLAGTLRGTIAMVGDELVWTFDIAGKRDGCKLELSTATHEPFTVTIDLRTRTGRIRSIDDEWFLGPPFPARRAP
jgi:hypothetical protein